MSDLKTTKKTSPTARALAQLRKEGHHAAVVERWNPYAKIRQDLFNFCDLLYITKTNIVAVQVTTGPHHMERKAKIVAEPRALAWVRAGGLIEVWSYTKAGAKGKRKLWTLRREEIVADDFKA